MKTETHTSMKFGVIVVGGGIAGSMAATAAAREGASVLLIEETGCLGGALTTCGTGPMMTFHAGDLQVIQGLGEELIQRLMAKGLSVGHVTDTVGYTYTVTPFDAEGMKRELELMVSEAGAQILYHAMVTAAEVENEQITAVTAHCCGQTLRFEADVFIDATGDADLAYMAGAPVEQGRESDGKDQPMTMNFKMVGVDIDAVRELMHRQIELFPQLVKCPERIDQAQRLSVAGFLDIMAEGMRTGELTVPREDVLYFETNAENEVIVNMTRVHGENPVDPFSLSRAAMEGRRQVWNLVGFMKKHIPGFEHARLIMSGPRIGVRSSRRIQGVYRLTARDILDERRFEDAIAACGYPIDIHSADGAGTDSTHLRDGAYYTIPYRSLLSSALKNLMAAGRNIATEFAAQASTRVTPCCTALGQAAGTAAAMAAAQKVLPGCVDTAALQARLKENGAFIG